MQIEMFVGQPDPYSEVIREMASIFYADKCFLHSRSTLEKAMQLSEIGAFRVTNRRSSSVVTQRHAKKFEFPRD